MPSRSNCDDDDVEINLWISLILNVDSTSTDENPSLVTMSSMLGITSHTLKPVSSKFPPTDRSDFYHEEFADELAQIISQPEYDRFCFKIEPELGNLTMDVVGNIFQESEPRVHCA
ncbi:hypothetical protein Tco_0169845 [Tanacetum coccineum]